MTCLDWVGGKVLFATDPSAHFTSKYFVYGYCPNASWIIISILGSTFCSGSLSEFGPV